MLEDNCDIKAATEKYKKKRARELKSEQRRQEKIRKWESVFSTNGDAPLNLYADAVVRDIANKLHVNYTLAVYGGSNSMKYFLNNERGVLEFPNILVYISANYTFENTNYINLDRYGRAVAHNYSCNALPIALGFMFIVMAKDNSQVREITRQLNNIYANEVIVTVPDPALNGEMCAVRIAVESNDDTGNLPFFDKINSRDTIYHSVVILKKFPSVYYTQCYVQADIEYNERLQFRLLQRIEFLMHCRKDTLFSSN